MIILLWLFALIDGIYSLPGRAACQNSKSNDWRLQCPHNTLLVGYGQKFPDIGSAIRALPNNTTPYTLLIQPGIYHEQINVTRPGPLTLLGVTSSPFSNRNNSVFIFWSAATGTRETGSRDNAFTSVLTVAPNEEASLTGSGPSGHQLSQIPPPGNEDFRAYNIDFANVFKPYSAGPSLAVSVSFANAGFYFCNIRSYQDTVYVGKLGNAYFYDGEIAGQVDFLYGFGTAWVEKSRLALRGCGGGITAWKGVRTAIPNKYGVYINNAKVEKENSTLSIKGKCSLGRPWNDLHRSIFANCELDDSIRGSGYSLWSGNDPRYDDLTFMAEYANKGPGFSAEARNGTHLSRILTYREHAEFNSPAKVFVHLDGRPGNTGWIDSRPDER